MKKKYSEFYSHLKKYLYLVAYNTFLMNDSEAEGFVQRETRRRYSIGCTLIISGRYTEADLIAMYPLT